MTLLTASRKSFSVTVFLRARMAYIPASVQTLLMSAPESKKEDPTKLFKIYLSHLYPQTTGNLVSWTDKGNYNMGKPYQSGKPNSTLRSNRPGRSSAGSRVSDKPEGVAPPASFAYQKQNPIGLGAAKPVSDSFYT
nr:hypothetical protein CLUG_03378 [Ipomoea batatas]